MPDESTSTPREIRNYLGCISGPLLDRIDLHIEVPPVKFQEFSAERTGELRPSMFRRRSNTARLTARPGADPSDRHLIAEYEIRPRAS